MLISMNAYELILYFFYYKINTLLECLLLKEKQTTGLTGGYSLQNNFHALLSIVFEINIM